MTNTKLSIFTNRAKKFKALRDKEKDQYRKDRIHRMLIMVTCLSAIEMANMRFHNYKRKATFKCGGHTNQQS